MCLPGCERLEAISEERLAVALAVPIPAVKGEYEGTVEIVEREPFSLIKMRIEVAGKSGFVNADALLKVEPTGEETSRVDYEADALVGGTVASVGQRMLTGISRRQVQLMMECLDRGGPRPYPWTRIAAWLRKVFTGRAD